MDHEYRFAVNVKSYLVTPQSAFDLLSEGAIQSVWDRCAENFWEDATELAREHGYADVHQEGRSGGWLVPMYGAAGRSPHRRLFTVSQWLEDCYESEEREHVQRFERFASAVRELQREYEYEYLAELRTFAEEERERRERLLECGKGTN